MPISALIGKVTEQQIAEKAQQALPREFWREVPPDARARDFLGDRYREALSAMWGVDLSAASEAELLDTDQYHLFPNFFPWLGYYLPIAYRFRPWRDDPNQCLMEIMILHPRPTDGRQVETAEMQLLEPGESWTPRPGLRDAGRRVRPGHRQPGARPAGPAVPRPGTSWRSPTTRRSGSATTTTASTRSSAWPDRSWRRAGGSHCRRTRRSPSCPLPSTSA